MPKGRTQSEIPANLEAFIRDVMAGRVPLASSGEGSRPPGEDLAARITAISKQLRQQKQNLRLGFLFGYCVPVIGFIFLKRYSGSITPQALEYALILTLVLHATFFAIYSSKAQSKRAKTVAELFSIDAPRAIGPLLEIISEPFAVNKEVEDALVRLLPRLSPAEAAAFGPRQRECFYRLLTRSVDLNRDVLDVVLQQWTEREANLKIALLRAAGCIGDLRCLPYVENLAAAKLGGPKAQLVRQAAQECLILLRQQADQKRSSETLLRASDPSATKADTLLRPTIGQANAEPEVLLRATARQEDTP